MRALFEFTKTTVIGGLLFLVPVVLLVVLLEKAVAIAAKLVVPVAAYFPDQPWLGVTSATLIAIVLLLVLSFGAGLFARTRTGNRFGEWIEEVVLSRLPGYVLIRGMVDDLRTSFAALETDKEQRSVFVMLDDGWQLGIMIEELPTGRLVVFVPGAPSPLSGSLYFMLPDRVRPSGLTVSDTASLLQRLGRGSTERLRDLA